MSENQSLDPRPSGELETLEDIVPENLDDISHTGLGSTDFQEKVPLLGKIIDPLKDRGVKECVSCVCGLGCLICCLLTTAFVLSLCLIFYFVFRYPVTHNTKCSTKCQYSIVESIPTEMNITYLNSLASHDVILYMLANAKKSVKTLQYYIELKNDADPAAHGDYGNQVFDMYIDTAKRGVDIEIIYNKVTDAFEEELKDLDVFKSYGIKVKSMDFAKYFGGVLHSKVIIVDDESIYIGSLNMDWKSFSQVKELGIYVRNCPCLAKDVAKIFEVYEWYMKDEQVDESYDTGINMNNTILVDMEYIDGLEEYNKTNTTQGHTYISTSPPGLNTIHRTSDLEAVLDIINRADEYIVVSVMDFLPFRLYQDPTFYWGDITDALKNAMVVRAVHVRLLISKWNYTYPMQQTFLQSMDTFGKICVNSSFCEGSMISREFVVPDAKEFHPQYNFTRVNHAKYMVSEKDVFISTSNWCEDYFADTAGMSLISSDERLRKQLRMIFDRDWNSPYSHKIEPDDSNSCKI